VARHARAVIAALGEDPAIREGDLGSLVQTTLLVHEDRGRLTRFEGRLTLSILNTTQAPTSSLAFTVAANPDARVIIERISVLEKSSKIEKSPFAEVSASGTASRWEVPIDLAPQDATEVIIAFRGFIPERATSSPEAPLALGRLSPGLAPPSQSAPPTLTAWLETLPELARLSPTLAWRDRAEVVGADAHVAVLADLWPRLATPVGPLAEVFEVRTPEAWRALTSSPTRREEGTNLSRIVHRDARDLAVVLARDFDRLGDPLTGIWTSRDATPPLDPERVDAVTRAARRAREVIDTRWGARPHRPLEVIGLSNLDAAVVLPDLLLLPESRLRGLASPSTNTTWKDLGARVLDHLPWPRESLEFAVAHAIAAQRAIGRAEPDASWSEAAIGHLGALRVLEASHGDKARRRAIELGLKLPFRLARLADIPDPVLASPDSLGPRSAKAGLFFEALDRHLGADAMDRLAVELLDTGSSRTRFDAALTRVAPRPDDARSLSSRWLDTAQADQDLGPFDPGVLLEYFASDGAIEALKGLALDAAARGRLAAPLKDALESGKLGPGAALRMLTALVPEQDVETRKWLSLGADLFSDSTRKGGLDALRDVLEKDLGASPEVGRALTAFGEFLLEATDPDAGPPASPP
jgi:hypothetical protein